MDLQRAGRTGMPPDNQRMRFGQFFSAFFLAKAEGTGRANERRQTNGERTGRVEGTRKPVLRSTRDGDPPSQKQTTSLVQR
jgi:hypothetical protein